MAFILLFYLEFVLVFGINQKHRSSLTIPVKNIPTKNISILTSWIVYYIAAFSKWAIAPPCEY